MNKITSITPNPESVHFSPERGERITRMLEGYVDRRKLPGFIATVAREGETVFYEKAGWMNIEAQTPMQDDAIFMIASMTKPITAVAAMMLYEEGYFHLNTPISKFIPAFSETPVYAGTGPEGGIYLDDRVFDITFRHLFTHTAGLSYGWEENDPIDQIYRQHQQKMAEDGVELSTRGLGEFLAQAPLAFQPGTHWRYSLSIDLLGTLIEIISGMPYEDFIQQRIFDPLGMIDTGFWLPAEKTSRLATIYRWAEPESGAEAALQPLDEFKPPHQMPSFASGGGGLWSTTQDYARFAQMMVNKGICAGKQLLSPSTVSLFSINQCPDEALPYGFFENDINQAGYGYSLGTRTLMDVGKSGKAGSIGEFGWGGKFKTYFWIDPRKSLYGLLMVQLDTEAEYEVSNQFKQLVYQAFLD